MQFLSNSLISGCPGKSFIRAAFLNRILSNSPTRYIKLHTLQTVINPCTYCIHWLQTDGDESFFSQVFLFSEVGRRDNDDVLHDANIVAWNFQNGILPATTNIILQWYLFFKDWYLQRVNLQVSLLIPVFVFSSPLSLTCFIFLSAPIFRDSKS